MSISKDPEIITGTSLEIRILTDMVARMSKRDVEKKLAASQTNLSSLQHSVMRLLSCQGFTISELSRKLKYDPATLVQTVDTLEREGLVKRGHDPKDRRRTPLALTEHGLKTLARIPRVNQEDALNQGLTRMGNEKAAQLLNLLRELAAYMTDDEKIIENLAPLVLQIIARAKTLAAEVSVEVVELTD